MSQGKRYKFQGSLIELLQSFADDSPGINITNITNANPAVVTASGHGLSDGDVVQLSGVGGTIEVNDGVYVAVNTTPTTFELADVDSTEYGTFTSGGTVSVGQFSQLCELTNYNRQGGTSPDMPATTVCSTAQEYEVGLPDFGTTQLSFNFAPRQSVQGNLHEFYKSGDVLAVRITLPKDGGYMVQLGFVQQETETAGVGGIWQATATLRNTGNRVDIEAA